MYFATNDKPQNLFDAVHTNGDTERRHAEANGVPLRTLSEVQHDLNEATANKADKSLARLMVNHGRLTDEARQFAAGWLA